MSIAAYPLQWPTGWKRTQPGSRAPAAVREWWDVLECRRDASPEVIKAQYRRLASEHHPDKGGDPGRMAEVNAAWARAQGAT